MIPLLGIGLEKLAKREFNVTVPTARQHSLKACVLCILLFISAHTDGNLCYCSFNNFFPLSRYGRSSLHAPWLTLWDPHRKLWSCDACSLLAEVSTCLCNLLMFINLLSKTYNCILKTPYSKWIFNSEAKTVCTCLKMKYGTREVLTWWRKSSSKVCNAFDDPKKNL